MVYVTSATSSVCSKLCISRYNGCVVISPFRWPPITKHWALKVNELIKCINGLTTFIVAR